MNAALRMPLMAEVHDLSVRLGPQQVLQGLNLSLRGGQWLAIVGPNGAGKSTLLRCLAGLTRPASGQVRWCDEAAAPGLLGARLPRCAWLGQNPAGDEAMSVEDTVALGRLPHQGWLGWPRDSVADRQAIAQALQDTDMSWAAQRALGALSGGERQRVSLARALAVQAPVLLLDEPVSHLDAPHQRLIARVLQREAALGRCVVSVLHELPLALCADRLLVIQAGRVVAEGSRDDERVHRAIEHIFDQALAISRVNGQWTAVPCL